ncbi:hypothetical protein BDD12DRAFT_878000 [Trichophaea hybrida]|nr:hypothetical protein BDD12DRAFT_878000 [Trichophaea hybrida]
MEARQFSLLAILHSSLVSSLAIRQSSSIANSAIQLSGITCQANVLFPILEYIATNYIAHAFTIRFSPGYGPVYTIFLSVAALIFPYFGFMAACRNLECLSLFAKDPLDRALKAGALCTVARTQNWMPEEGDKVWMLGTTRRNHTTFPGSTLTPTQGLQRCDPDSTKTLVYCEEEGLEALQQRYIAVHGLCRLPRAHAEHKDSYACDVPMSNHLERKHSELFPQHPRGPKQLQEFRNCQKGQYMLVRIPPHCSVKWKHRSYFNLEFTRHHETDTWKDDIMKDTTPRRISYHDVGISASHSVLKSVIAFLHLYSVVRILQSPRIQVNKYGSYRLTVVPYGLMSLVNILSAIFSPSYPSVYMVDSSVMREARRRGGIFDGVVGELEEDEEFETAEEEYAAVEERGGTIEQCGVPTTKTRGSVKVKEMPAPRTEPRISAVIRYRRFQPDGDDIYQGYLYYLLQNIPVLRSIRRITPDLPEPPNSAGYFGNIASNLSDSNNYYFVLSIGNAKHRHGTARWVLHFVDVMMLFALGLPYVIIYRLTGFKTPSSVTRGAIFLLWLALGQIPLPALVTAYWDLIHIRISQLGRVKMVWKLIAGVIVTCLFTPAALAGFYFVGQMKYIELTTSNSNCSAVINEIARQSNV